jgi:hypothetical protein
MTYTVVFSDLTQEKMYLAASKAAPDTTEAWVHRF